MTGVRNGGCHGLKADDLRVVKWMRICCCSSAKAASLLAPIHASNHKSARRRSVRPAGDQSLDLWEYLLLSTLFLRLANASLPTGNILGEHVRTIRFNASTLKTTR
jgi:hypothetical protein